MDWDAIGALLAALGLKLANIVAGAFTSFAALRFFDGLKKWERWTTFFGGWAIAAFGAPPFTEYFELKPKLEVGAALLLGMFGMAAAAAIIKLIKETDWPSLVRALLGALGRRPNGGGQ